MDKPAWFVRERPLAGTGRELPLDGAVCGDGAGDRGDRLERIGVTCYPRFPVTQGLNLNGVAVAGRRAVMVNGASDNADRRALEGCAPRSRACLATAHRVGELGM